MRTRYLGRVAALLIAAMPWVYGSGGSQCADAATSAPITPPAGFVGPEAPQEATDEAKVGKQILERLVAKDDKHARDLGFKSAAEAADMKTELGKPFPIVRIDFGKLLAFRPDKAPTTLLVPTNEFIYPVTVDGKIRSSLTVTKVRPDHKTGKAWRTTVYGRAGVIQLLDETVKIGAFSPMRFLATIPELNRYFLGDIKDGKFIITPIGPAPHFKEKEGTPLMQGKISTPLPAERVFEELVPEAKRRTKGGAG